MKVSLHSFCRDNNLPKSSVYRRCQELNIATSDGLLQEDCDRLLVEFGKVPIAVEAPKDVAANSAIVPVVVHEVEAAIVSPDLVARKIQPRVVGYDTSELDLAADLNQETMEFNINSMGAQLIEQMKQLGKLHAAQARQAYAHTIATELSQMVGKTDAGSKGAAG